MEEPSLKTIAARALQKIIGKKYRAQTFSTYLINLEQSSDLEEFINNLYINMDILKLKIGDLLQIIIDIGSHQNTQNEMRYAYLSLWFEFTIIDEGNFKERPDLKLLENFPLNQAEQLKRLQSLCYTYSINYIPELQKTILEKLKSQNQFQEVLKMKDKRKISKILESKLKGSKINIQNLSSNQNSNIYMQILIKMNNIIGQIDKIKNVKDIYEKLKDFVDDILQRNNNYERLIVSSVLSEAFHHILGIKVNKNNCSIDQLQQNVIKERLNAFKLFFEFQFLVQKCIKGEYKFNQLVQKMFDLLCLKIKTIWYWPISDKTSSLAVYIIENCLRQKKLTNRINQILTLHPPNLSTHIYNMTQRTFLQQILSDIQNFGLIANNLSTLAKKQQIDINMQLKSGDTYYSLLKDRRIPESHISRWISAQTTQPNEQFFIFCFNSKKKQPIFITKQHQQELLDKTKNVNSYTDIELNSAGYRLKCLLSGSDSKASYDSGPQNRQASFRNPVSFSGILNYGKIFQFINEVKNFVWLVIERENWKFFEINSAESQLIGEQIIRCNKQNDVFFHFKMSNCQNMLMEVNCNSLEVSQLIKYDENDSKLKKKFGYLVYIPAHKKDNGDSNNFSVFNSQEINYPQINEGMLEKTVTSIKQEQRKIIDFEQVFPFIGVFSSMFQVLQDYTIDQQKSVHAEKPVIVEYFKKWQNITLYQLIDKYIEQNIENSAANQTNSFRLDQKIVCYVTQELQNIQKKLNKKIIISYDKKKEQLSILNMLNTKEGLQFFNKFISYLIMKVSHEKQKKIFYWELTKDQQRYLQNRAEDKIVDKVDNLIQISCTKEQKDKLLEELQLYDQIHEATYDCPEAYEEMKKKEAKFLSQKQVKDIQIGKQIFTVSMPLKFHPNFKKMLYFYKQQFEEKRGDILQEIIQNQGIYIQLYSRQLQKIDPQIGVSKINNDIFIQYSKKYEKNVKKVLQKMPELKQKQYFSYAQRSSKQHVFKNISQTLIHKLKGRIQYELTANAQQKVLPSQIDLDYDQKNKEYILTARQISPQNQTVLIKLISKFRQKYEEFINQKNAIVSTKKFTNDCFDRLPKQKMTAKYLKNMHNEFKTNLRSKLNQIILPIVEQTVKNLENQFQIFIQKKDFDSSYSSQLLANQNKNIMDNFKKINIFEDYMMFFIKSIGEKEKKNLNISLVSEQLKGKIQQLNQKFQINNLMIEDISQFFKSLNILATIFYGQQLPITEHLKKFKKLLQQNDVVMVKTGTGSGKSTVIPPYLIGLGYKKVAVTQPRRLPCRQIYKRISSIFGEGVTGYEIADDVKDSNNSLVYMTDGLLKMKVLFSQQVLDTIDILVIDQIHQRSANIDILLLLLSEYFAQKPRKLKLVLCSATIDSEIGKILQNVGLKVDSFFVDVIRHPVKEVAIQQGSIVDRILLLAGNLQSSDQMLVFFPGVKEVNDTVAALKKRNRPAYPLTAVQTAFQQQKYLQIGQIFIATAIAETSLTFRNLKYVVDSRLSRSRMFNPQVQLVQTIQDYCSNSSIQQRKGRLGRTGPGEYHYFFYHDNDFKNNREHNQTELQKIDITNSVFQLLLRPHSTFASVKALIQKLYNNKTLFQDKITYTKNVLMSINILDKNDSLQRNAMKLLVYGDLGNPQYNYALFQANGRDCGINMSYIIAFLMIATNVTGNVIQYLKSQKKEGDIKAIHDFIAQISNKINLEKLHENQIKMEMAKKCTQINDKPWFNVIVRVIIKVKHIMKSFSSWVSNPNWSDVKQALIASFDNKIFFNQSAFGGNKSKYEKIRNEQFCFDLKNNQNRIIYKMDINSLIYNKDSPSPAIFSLNCAISPQNECILSLCQNINPNLINKTLIVSVKGYNCETKYFNKDSKPIKQQQIFEEISRDIKNNYRDVLVQNNFPQTKFQGKFKSLIQGFSQIVDKKRRNNQIKIDLRKILIEAIDRRLILANANKMMPVISKEYSLSMLYKLSNYDLKKMFQTMRFEMLNNYEVEIDWDSNIYEIPIIVKNAKNIHLKIIITKLINFARWFADSQTICNQQYKIKPHRIEDHQDLPKDVKQKIMQRVNQIVDSKLDYYVVKSWANGKGPSTQYPRTARMIAVCWVLVTMFNCTIKGGFVRDWVVNKDEKLPNGPKTNLLQKNARNPFLQVVDETVTPSDIDAELSYQIIFDEDRFTKQMKKLGINILIEEDGWRKHIIFDDKTESGGFTADLIEPYTSMCHDTYDFDVNTLYITKDNINAIGMKIPLQFEQNNYKTKIQLQKLLSTCRKKQMTLLKSNMPAYRLKKFKERGWKIDEKKVLEPIIYKDVMTKSMPVDPQTIKDINQQFYQQMVVNEHVKIIQIQKLTNKSWDDAFESTTHWIISEMQKAENSNDQNGFQNRKNINSNNKILFHGSSADGIQGIKKYGFDSRYFGDYGFYGRGAYFADNPIVSHGYAKPNQKKNGQQQIFIVKVALGKQETLTVESNKRLGPGKGFHSILGTGRPNKEYIIERWGQAKPLYLITYKK